MLLVEGCSPAWAAAAAQPDHQQQQQREQKQEQKHSLLGKMQRLMGSSKQGEQETLLGLCRQFSWAFA
jgi:hypothetical protein